MAISSSQLPEEYSNFWPVFQWESNPWIVDSAGNELKARALPFIKQSTIADLHLQRLGQTSYVLVDPMSDRRLGPKRVQKLKEWMISIITGSPTLRAGDRIQVPAEIRLWTEIALTKECTWTLAENGTMRGKATMEGDDGALTLRRLPGGILRALQYHDSLRTKDMKRLQAAIKKDGITFQQHPATISLLLPVQPQTRPKAWMQAVEQRRVAALIQDQAPGKTVKRLERLAAASDWNRHAIDQTPLQVWQHRDCTTPFQRWTMYRITSTQLNLYYPDQEISGQCNMAVDCGTAKETIVHIIWECQRAQQTWKLVGSKWTGQEFTMDQLRQLLPHIASRNAPPPSTAVKQAIQDNFGFFSQGHQQALKTAWFAICTIVPCVLWQCRNSTVHEQIEATPAQCSKQTWQSCVKQLRAVARKKRSIVGKRSEAICLSQCVSVLHHAQPQQEQHSWRETRLYFDGRARGNPGPGGSVWVLAERNNGGHRRATACGYKYTGADATNNKSEYTALLEGVLHAAEQTEPATTHLQVFGDSNMIIE